MRTLQLVLVTSACLLLVAPAAFAALGGSGQVTDIVQLSTTTGTLSALSSAGTPVASGSAFTMTNSGSNVDTFLRYAWSTTPYYGPSSSSTSISIRSTTHYVSDMLWFQQQTLTAASVATTSEVFSPLLIKNSAQVATVTWTTGSSCASWANSPGSGFTGVSGGSFTVKYYVAASPVDNTPTTSDTFHYCLDTSTTQAYLGKSADFSTATRVYSYLSDSSNGALNNYRYHLRPNSVTTGNQYCLTGFTGTGTSATPDLAQCQMLPYETLASTTAKLFVLMDTPLYFPSVNQGGAITYAVSGTQWNPYSYATTNPA